MEFSKGLTRSPQERHHRLENLLEKVKEITSWAEIIHLGVQSRRKVRTSTGNESHQDVMSESAILLASIVDALGAIFNMLVEAVRDARLTRKSAQSKHTLASKVSNFGDEACGLLRKARDELITEANGVVPGESVGPVLTPEAILIMLMERLARGVFGSGSVEIIAIYEDCLEHLVRLLDSSKSTN